MFVEQVQDIVQQLKEHPERLPIVSSQPTDGRLSFENMENSSIMPAAIRPADKELSEPPGSCQGSPVRQLKPLTAQLQQAATTGHLAPSPVEEQAPTLFPPLQSSPPVVAMVQPPTPVTKVVPEGDSSSRLGSPCGDDTQTPLSCSSSVAMAANATPPSSSMASAPHPSTAAVDDNVVVLQPAQLTGVLLPCRQWQPTQLGKHGTMYCRLLARPGRCSNPGDLGHLQQKLVELTTPCTHSATDTGLGESPAANVATPVEPAAPASPKHVAAHSVAVSVAAVSTTPAVVTVAPSSSRPSSVPPERKPAVATNLEDLKLELQKLHGNTMKSNIEQGLQAIFSQNTVVPVLTPAHSQPQVPPLSAFAEHPATVSHSVGAVMPQAPSAAAVLSAHSAGQISSDAGSNIPVVAAAGNAAAATTTLPVSAPCTMLEPAVTRPQGIPLEQPPASSTDNAADLKVPLVKAVFFASGAWRDVKSETILHCFEKAGFSRGSSAAEEITAEADIDAVAADGAAAVTSLGQLWEAADNASLVPSRLDYLDFALADQDLVTTEELTTDELAASVSEKGTAADSSSSDGEGDDVGAPQPGTAGAALAAVDTLRMYLCTEPGSCDLMDNVEQRVLKRALAKRVQGTLDRFFQKV
ncbi:hypothetical protein HPB52_001347 [Rhipicephalus sanguineus]|uniref:Uncharacterized protein n=1 Tax=Rhipicephalus sanguineus TaxID=34632 RepID=A0A9D4QDX0_RHISA|nr:hypothetical protein HPB52_001347 [Rhipicephalus sanguineus]